MFFRKRQMEQDLADEFQFHLEQQIAAGIARGLTPDDARAEAMRALDRMELRKEECRDARGWNFLESIAQDLRYAARVLRKSPAFTTVAVISLALGIGANTAVFSLMDVLLLRPLPVKQPERLQLLSIDKTRYSFPYSLFEQINARATAFTETFAWDARELQTPVGGDMLLVPAAFASGGYFSGLGVPPAAGRVFGPDDDRPDGGKSGPVAVISDGYWTRRYGRNASAIGQSVVLNGVASTIIGVMPPGFFGAEVGQAPDIWVPLNMQRQLEDPRCISSRSCWYLRVMARLKPGLSPQQAAADLHAVSPGIMNDTLPPDWTRPGQAAGFLRQVLQPESGAAGFTYLRLRVRTPLRILMALVAVVLLIACANLANLLTARASARYKEVAVRLAMGAGRARVIRQMLIESLLLATAGAAGGFLVAVWAARALTALLSNGGRPLELDLNPDWRLLLFTASAATFTGVLCGLWPAFRATRGGVSAALKDRTHQIRGAESRFGFGRLLLGAQVALSIVLLAAAGLFAGSLVWLLMESPGFNPKNVTVISLITSKRPEKGAALNDLFGRMLERTRTLPGVESATLLSTTPLSNSGWNNFITLIGRSDVSEDRRLADLNVVATSFFETMRIPVLAGRDFNDGDNAESARVALMSDNAARAWFPRGGAIGSYVAMPDKHPIRIIGTVGNTKYWNLRDAIPLTLYFPYRQITQGGLSIAVRTQMPVNLTYAAFHELLRQVAPGTPIRTVRTMDDQVDESLSTERLTAYLSLFIAGLALLLTAVGLYGILAYSVSRRTGEIGIRMALGAQPGNVVWLVIREVLAQISAGAAVGILCIAATSRFVASLLYGVRPNDPWTIALAVASLGAVCVIAGWIPARRATQLDPMTALREE